MKKHLITTLCAVAMIFSQINIVEAAKTYPVDTVVEAEDLSLGNGMTYWTPVGASGGAVYSNNPAISEAKFIPSEDLTFHFNVESDSTYSVYMRATFTNSNGSYFYRIDDGNWQYVNYGATDWTWIKLSAVQLDKGIHTVAYSHAARGGDIDAFFITKDEGKLPTDIGKKPSTEVGTDVEPENGLTDVVQLQKNIPTITGNGLCVEAEAVTYCSPYILFKNKQASGGYGLQTTKDYKDGAGADRRGQVEFTFNVEKGGTYVAWARMLASSAAQDSMYCSMEGQGYATIAFEDNYNEFYWVKCATKALEAGDTSTFRIITRESKAVVDAILITSGSFTPTGRTGNIPAGETKSQLSSKYPKTPITPPSTHPRVLFRESDIARIKANMQKPQNVPAYEKLASYLETPTDGVCEGTYDYRLLNKIEAFAFDYAINGNRESGEIATRAIVNYLNTSDVTGSTDNITRNGGNVIYISSEVYDWCYDLLTTKQKANIISKCEGFAHKMEMKWPPDSQGVVTGHGSEAQLLRCTLAFAIATYNERPDIWNAVGGRYYAEFVPARSFFHAGAGTLQGDSYGLYRYRWDLWSYFLITGMGAPAPFDTTDLANTGYLHIYMRRPDGQLLRDGDTANDTSYSMWEYWSGYFQTYIMNSSLTKDPYLKDEAYKMSPSGASFYDATSVLFLVVNDPDVEVASVENLPKSKIFGDPAGYAFARTGWEQGAASGDVVCEMKVGGVMPNGHQHLDAGHFQLYYKGILASDSGVYQGMKNDTSQGGTHYNSTHRSLYMTKTIAHNSMLIYDPNESTGNNNLADIKDGGQRAPGGGFGEMQNIDVYNSNPSSWTMATVEASEIDPTDQVNPSYTYVKGDLTNAYSSKVKDFKRSFMFFNLFDDEVPAALVVFDKVTSSNASFKKTWLLHGLEKPTVDGMQTIFRRTYQSPITPSGYNGKMTVDTLLPNKDDADIKIVGGEEDGYSNINGVDYTGLPSASHVDEGNTYRMELSPKGEHTTDYFLNVIQVSDNDKEYYLKSDIIENTLFYGACIKDRAVLFAKSGTTVGESFTITLPRELTVSVCDVLPGKWQLEANGVTSELIANEDACVITFTAGGEVKLTYIGEGKREVIAPTLGHEREIRLMIEDQFVVAPVAPQLINDRLMIPLSTMVNWFKLDENVVDGCIVLSNGNNTFNVGNMGVQSGSELLIPARAVVEAFGGSITWYDLSQTASIMRPPVDYSLPAGYFKVKTVTPDSGAVDGENVCTNAIDGNGDTIWAALGKGRYIDLELEAASTLSRVEILFNPNGGRSADFEIQVSDNGIDYRTVITDVSDGSLEGVAWEVYDLPTKVKTKYIRYVANGSNISDWNAIKEIRFK